MITLFKNIENYKELDLRDMLVVAWNFDFFVPPKKADAYCKEVDPVYRDYYFREQKYLSAFEEERKNLSSIIEKYFDQEYFDSQKANLKKNMFDVNYVLKKYLNNMNKEQLVDFGTVISLWYVKLHLFMTHYSWLLFANETIEIVQSSKLLTERFKDMTEDQLRSLFLKHIDMNVILADNVAEAILNGVDVNNALSYVDNVLTMRQNNRYRMRILM